MDVQSHVVLFKKLRAESPLESCKSSGRASGQAFSELTTVNMALQMEHLHVFFEKIIHEWMKFNDFPACFFPKWSILWVCILVDSWAPAQTSTSGRIQRPQKN